MTPLVHIRSPAIYDGSSATGGSPMVIYRKLDVHDRRISLGRFIDGKNSWLDAVPDMLPVLT